MTPSSPFPQLTGGLHTVEAATHYRTMLEMMRQVHQADPVMRARLDNYIAMLTDLIHGSTANPNVHEFPNGVRRVVFPEKHVHHLGLRWHDMVQK